MKIEDQVCSLELSKKLRQLGVKQESLFYISENEGVDIITNEEYYAFEEKVQAVGKCDGFSYEKFYPAYTVAELGVMLPHFIYDNNVWLGQSIFFKNPQNFSVFYGTMKSKESISISDNTEADARAKMLIYLLENEIITVEEVNERLVK